MKTMLVSFAVGLLVGALYAFLRVRSPAPPLAALMGLLGMVWGEQVIQRWLTPTPAQTQTAPPKPAGQTASKSASNSSGMI
jgi:XapX domain-containing protein